ncbi:MAG: protein translocase subunit SecF [Candidatus Gastranaerophilales bacterium]|nr:protein translocase subunit SecF [Candidatus Gastranaerophilales bacterium]
MSYSVLNTKKIIDVVKYRWIWLLLSAILLLPGIVAMGWSMKVYPTHTPMLVGIDFTGGTIIQYSVDKDVSTKEIEVIRTKLSQNDIENPVIQILKPAGIESDSSIKNIISIRTQFSDNGQNESIDKVSQVISQDYPEAQIVQVNSVGPVLGKQLFVNSMIAVGLALLAIVIYLTLRFHFEFAIVAFLALFHDVFFVIGVFSILGLLYGVHIDSLFVTAILTVLGFSVHDTIVVFDRIRENLKFYSKKATYDEIVNASVNQTLARSINTSLTTLITLGALYFFGGVTTKDFVLVMILGIAIGTYSSIFFASTLVALWNDIENAKKVKAAANNGI